MKTFAVITSMSEAYYQQCGQACIESFGAHWPANIPLYVYNEGIIDPPKRKWVTYLPWEDLGSDFVDFCARTSGNRTVTFAKKAFSILAGLRSLDVDRLIWMDADVVSTFAINQQLLEMISPDKVLSTHFGVKHPWPSEQDADRTSFSCETGFFILNRRHQYFQDFYDRYLEYYVKDIGYGLRRFYDGEVYGAVIAELEDQGCKMLELNPGQKHRTPIPRSILAPYIMHYKAGAKEQYNSLELLAKHGIQYETSDLPSNSTSQELKS